MRILFPLTRLLFLVNYCDGFNVATSSQQSRSVSSTLIGSVPNDHMGDNVSDSLHSFVEGEAYDGQLAEIEAMGGDPFFMDDEVDVDNEKTKDLQNEKEDNLTVATTLAQASEFSSLLELANKASSTNGKGPTRMEKNNVQERGSDWVWDGIVDEDAHMGLE